MFIFLAQDFKLIGGGQELPLTRQSPFPPHLSSSYQLNKNLG